MMIGFVIITHFHCKTKPKLVQMSIVTNKKKMTRLTENYGRNISSSQTFIGWDKKTMLVLCVRECRQVDIASGQNEFLPPHSTTSSSPGPIVPAFLPTSAPVVPVHRQQLGSTGHCHLLGHCSPTPVNIFHSFRFRQNEYSLDINCWLPLCRDWNHPALVGSFHLHKVRMNDEMQDKDQCLNCDYEWSGCGTKCLNQDSSRVLRISWFTTSTSWWPS